MFPAIKILGQFENFGTFFTVSSAVAFDATLLPFTVLVLHHCTILLKLNALDCY